MASSYDVSAEAQEDLFEIWQRIAMDSVDLADRIESEFYKIFELLAAFPRLGHRRTDLTAKPVLFFPMYSFLVIYRPEVEPIRIMAVVRGYREVGRVIEGRT